ncbi:MAG: hypothetical protein WA755_00325 [Candidatus Acidiferrales bacterium]
MNRKIFLIAVTLVAMAALAACGGSGSAGVSIALTNVPASLTINQSTSLSAVVSNDTTNAGVDWTCSPSGSCGTFNPTHTASGSSTSYTAPGAAGSVTVTATATADSSAHQSSTIQINSSSANGSLTGQYVYFVQGSDANGSIYTAVGSITADGNGNITTGEQDFEDSVVDSEQASLSGSYSIGSDGRGSVTLNISDISLPSTETFSFATTSTTHSLIIEFDGNATSSGTLDFQAPSAFDMTQINGGYAFTLSGEDLTNEVPIAFGGVATLNASATSLTNGTLDVNDGGDASSFPITGSISAPDLNGRGTITTSENTAYAYYAVQGEALRLIEEDGFIAGGTAYGQGTAATNATNSSLMGNYVLYDSASTLVAPLGLVGQFTADGGGNITVGVADTNDGGSFESAASIATSTYSIPSGTGGQGTLTFTGNTQDVTLLNIFVADPTLNLLDPNNTSGAGGALIMDNSPNSIGNGLIIPQVTGSFTSGYAVNLQYFSSTAEVDLVGQAAAGASSLTGNVDVNDSGTTESAISFTAQFSADSSNPGRYTGNFSYGGVNIRTSYYQASTSQILVLDTDGDDVGNGFVIQQQP